MKVKIKGFLKDITGSMRAEKRRKTAIKNASASPEYSDPIREVADELHPVYNRLIVTKVEEVSPTAKRFTFENEDGSKLPPFEAGQCLEIDVKIGETRTTRAYSICSAPYEARLEEHPHVAITVRNGKEDGFVANYLYANVKEGEVYTAHLPFGHFYIEPLRDSKKILGLAGGSGITPFLAMAKEIEHGTLDADLTVLYGSVSSKDIILEKQLAEVKSPRVKFVHVISGEPDYPGEKGYLSAEIIKKYAGEGDVTYFVCGPLPMYLFLEKELAKLKVKPRRIRMETFGAPRDITKAEGYPKGAETKVHKLTVVRGIDKTVIEAKASEPLLVAMERAGILVKSGCRSGTCGICRVKLVSGEVFVPKEGDGRRYADKEYGYVHSCSTYPLSDCEIITNIL